MKNPSLIQLRQESERSFTRLPKWLRVLLWCAGIWALVCALGFYVAPPIVRGQLEKQLSERLHRRVTVGKVRLNPFTLSLSLETLSVADPAGGKFFGWRRLLVNFDAFSFLVREWRFQEIALDGFWGRVAVAKDGRLNFSDLLESLGGASTPASAQTTRKAWPLLVRHLAISDARISYSDASRGVTFASDIGPTSVSLRNFSTGGAKQAPGEFSATTESGETLSWKGALSLAPLSSSGEVTLSRIALKKYAPYYANRVKFDLRDGRLDLALHYEFSLENGKPLLRVSGGRVALDSLEIAKRGVREPVIALKHVELTGVAATYPKISVHVARLAVTGGSIGARRTADGIDLFELLTPVAPAAQPAVSVALAAVPAFAPDPLDATVSEVSIRDLAVSVEDESTPRPARHELTNLACDLRNLSLAAPAMPIPFGFKANLAPEGVIHAAGTIALAPLKVELGLELTAISLANVSPYAERFVNMRIGKGRLTTALDLKLELPAGLAPVVSVQGDVTVSDFAAFDAASVDELAGWRDLAIKGVEYDSATAKLMISEITWTEPTGHLIVNADGTNNFAEALKQPGAAQAPGVTLPGARAVESNDAEPLFVALDRFVLENAAFDFVDRTVQPNVHVGLGEFSGEIEGLASSELARATVNLQGRIDGIAPVVVTGNINPLSAQTFTDLKVMMKGIELGPVGPYVGKFAGYKLERGSLNLDVKCRVVQQKIDVTNVVTIDQFTLGNATNSPEATTLPVRLAVALLRDTSGRIVLDVPVQGNLDDPNFRVGRVVLRVITNLLAKVATSPFSMLGSMFGADKGQDLSYLQFKAGAAETQSEAETKKLDVVAKALLGRPALRLQLVGGYDEAVDGPALREQALEIKMRNLIWEDRRLVEPDITLDQIQLDPVQKMGMVRRFYYKTFPSEAPRRASITPAKPSGPVSGQRGNLGVFQHGSSSVSRPRPVAKPEQPPSAGTAADETATDPTPKIPEPKVVNLEEMKARLLERMTVDEETYRQLASNRANAVRKYLVDEGQVPADRISLLGLTDKTLPAKGTRVELHLK